MPYKLSATLVAHSSDVRALSSPTNDLILSASRDTTAISWQRPSPDSPFAPASVLKAGSRYVNSVAYIPPSPEAPKGYAVTGGQDTVINIFSLDSPRDDPDFTLIGHTENVCALDVTPGGAIISGSWDRTARVWKNFAAAYELKGHQQSVWAVLAVDEDQYLTGSADKTIKLWQRHKVIQTFTGHGDAVRGLALMPEIGFASCSNDSEIRVWTFGGDVVYALSGHTSFVYSLSVLPNGDLVSSGEDRTVRVWKDGECAQTIVHPATSVWAVSTMPNGDIVSGASDGVVRIFSSSEERWASESDLKEYDERVASQALPSQQIGDVKKSDLPGLEALDAPGKKPGEVKMVRNGSNVEAHQWDSASNSWQKIGDVVDAVGQGRKQLYQGKEYDYVFDVDIQDGVPPLKLPYNVTDNPFVAAQKFLETNDLPLSYIDQVVKFIEQNTSSVNIGTGGEEYVDPFTGASRYRSSAAPATSAPASAYQDPWTGASRYTARETSARAAPATGYVDPFTGASRYTMNPPPAGPVAATSPNILPVGKFITFKQANVAAMQAKLQQFDEVLENEISTSSLAMYPEERSKINDVFAFLTEVTATPPRRPATSLSATHVEAVMGILDRWPSSQRFPVIDLSRLVAGFSPEAFEDLGLRDRFLESLFKACEWDASWSLPLAKPRETNILLLFRTLANVFHENVTLEGTWLNKVFEALGQVPYASLNKTQRVALATILFNMSCVSLRGSVQKPFFDRVTGLILRVLESETADTETVYRALVGLGNLIYTAKAQDKLLDGPQAGEIAQCLGALPVTFPEERVQNVSREIGALMA
ncbi:putative PFU (PLAA family ubiquitin binding) [Lyophyllum shimeji]|uniref:PFU (PLAA family ubiquitin binding) n=1 Tax=Lyophyllum shimeji TaxID=47721 RepID=A0A9P3PF13_LYOSH|nr:putative PFU (PLAA family ubiquitin binding) [Lyophyllum shimeji]